MHGITRTIQYFRTPGTVESVRCEICGTVCKVERDIDSYTSWASAMARRKSRVDFFTCPHGQADWHVHAVRLVDAIAETPSPRLAALMQLDLDELLAAYRSPDGD